VNIGYGNVNWELVDWYEEKPFQGVIQFTVDDEVALDIPVEPDSLRAMCDVFGYILEAQAHKIAARNAQDAQLARNGAVPSTVQPTNPPTGDESSNISNTAPRVGVTRKHKNETETPSLDKLVEILSSKTGRISLGIFLLTILIGGLFVK
jgi:hypothetical protein